MACSTETDPNLEQLDQKLDAALPKSPPAFDSTAARSVLFDEGEHRAFLRWFKGRRQRARAHGG